MNFLTSLRTLALAIILSIGISYTYAAWSPPSVAPTGGNAEAPVNVGGATQVKSGALAVNGLLTAVSNLMIGSCSQPGCPTGPLTINNTTEHPWVDIRSNGDANNYSAISLWSNNGGAWPVFSGGGDTNKRWAIGHRKVGTEENNFFIEECDGNCTNSPSNSANFKQRLTIEPGGNIGVSQKDPTAKLHVGGTPGVDGIRFPDGTLQTTAAGASLTKNPSPVYQCPDLPYGVGPNSNGLCFNSCNGQLQFNSSCKSYNFNSSIEVPTCVEVNISCGVPVGYLVQ